jgi:RNA polymerase sigma factor (sigma-70 family)
MRSNLLSQPARAIGASLLHGQTDERLISLSRAGHQDAYAAIVRRHRPALLRYCTRIVGADRAQDAVQQTFIAAHAAMLKDERDINLKPWLYRIAHNAALGLMRGQATLSVVPDQLPDESATGPQELAELRERLERTIAAIDVLPRAQRDAVLLQAFEGASHEEVATALGISQGAARQQLYRARSTLRTAVSSLTPMPLLTKLMVATGGGASAVGWTEVATGSGIGAVTLKLGAGLAATAAIAGGGIESGVIDPPNLRSGSASAQTAPPSAGTPRSAAAVVSSDDRIGRSGKDDHGEDDSRKSGPGSDHEGGRGKSDDDGPRPAGAEDRKGRRDKAGAKRDHGGELGGSGTSRKGRKHGNQEDRGKTVTIPVTVADDSGSAEAERGDSSGPGSGRVPDDD